MKIKIFKVFSRILVFTVILAIAGFMPFDGNISAAGSSSVLVCIDPGHGGSDPGAIGPTGLTEKSVNLDIALRLKSKLISAGYRVIMTRETDVYKSLDDRVKFANSNGANIFISVHNNAFTTSGPNGTETYYCTYSPALSRNLATAVHNATLSQINTYNRGVKTANFYVLKNTTMVSALLEGVFISNPTEEAKLKDSGFRDKIATGICNGIKEFNGSYDVAPYQATINDFGNTPQKMYPGETKTFNITVKNLSTSFTWPATGTNRVNISYHLYDKYQQLVKFDGTRSSLPRDIKPGETVTIPVTIAAPATTGEYKIEYDLVHEGVTWFAARGSATLMKNFTVYSEESLNRFIVNLYQYILNRGYTQTEFDQWKTKLKANTATAGSTISTFIKSAEFRNRNLTDQELLIALYQGLLNRMPDVSGNDYWMRKISEGKTRAYILSSLFKSAEFSNICASSGVTLGSLASDIVINNYIEEEVPDDDDDDDSGDDENSESKISEFVNNIFTNLLGRDCAEAELTTLQSSLAAEEKSAGDLIVDLVNCDEFDSGLTNQEFVNIFYKALLNRAPDTSGNTYWLGRIDNGESWAILPSGMAGSAEFKGICSSLEINPGAIDASQITADDDGEDGEDDEDGGDDSGDGEEDGEDGGDDETETEVDAVSEFINNIYLRFLGSSPEEAVLLEWKNDLESKENTVSDLVLSIYESSSYDSQIGNQEFINQVYQALLGRFPDDSGNTYWLNELAGGYDRLNMISQFISCQEFINKCNGLDIDPGTITIEDPDPPVETIGNGTNIIGQNSVTAEMLVEMFIAHNPSQETRARRIAPYYIQYGKLFNLRADIAWAQMCHETGFLAYTGIVPPEANNFCGLGATGQKDANGNYVYNSFATEELGIIAHYIHLAWYACPSHLTVKDSSGDLYCSTKYDPRHFTTGHNYNGSSTLGCLNTRWAPATNYTDKIIQFANEIYQ